MGRTRTPAVERFWPQVSKGEPSACWFWTGTRYPNGYGKFHLGGKNGKGIGAHRFAYELLVGPIPDGLTLDHLCRNPPCVNPAHLEPVTQRENTLRGTGFIARQAAQTHCKRGHPLSGENLAIEGAGYRRCRACRREQNWSHYQRVTRQQMVVGDGG